MAFADWLGNSLSSICVKTETVSESEASKAEVEPRPLNSWGFRLWPAVLALLLVGAACAKTSSSGGSPTASDSPLSLPALKLAVLDAVGGHLAYCDPDLYPVARGIPLDNAKARLPTIQADRTAFHAILAHEQLSAGQQFTSDELIAIDNDYKQMQAIDLKPASDGGYTFNLLVPQPGSDVGTLRLSGAVTRAGVVTLGHHEVGQRPNCPICLAAGVRIATPNGEIPVQDLRVGIAVWTTDLRGRRIAGVVLETGHMEAPLGHEVVLLTLADGRTVVASPGHPTADDRTVGDLRAGARYDGSVVTSTTLIPYTGATWDLLPSGPTRTYFANGVLLGSTLSPVPAAPGIHHPPLA
jgi:hypothetical protein